MSSVLGVVPNSKKMGFDDDKRDEFKEKRDKEIEEKVEKIGRKMSESSLGETEDDDNNESDDEHNLELGPQCSLKDQLEKDKDDESLRKWKEQLLGSVDITSIGEVLEPEVKILSLAIKSAGRPDIFLPIPESGKPKGLWFTLKEGSNYNLNFTFQVTNNIVSGLKYTNTVWKTGVKVDSAKEMLGTFSPQVEPYTHEMPEETTPSGFFARGSYSAKTKVLFDQSINSLCKLIVYDMQLLKLNQEVFLASVRESGSMDPFYPPQFVSTSRGRKRRPNCLLPKTQAKKKEQQSFQFLGSEYIT